MFLLTFNRVIPHSIECAALEAVAVRTAKLLEVNSEQAELELAQHAQITDALFQRFTCLSVGSAVPDVAVKFLKSAILAQSTYLRIIGAIETLKQARLSRTRATVENGV